MQISTTNTSATAAVNALILVTPSPAAFLAELSVVATNDHAAPNALRHTMGEL